MPSARLFLATVFSITLSIAPPLVPAHDLPRVVARAHSDCSHDLAVLSEAQPVYPRDASPWDRVREHSALISIDVGADGKVVKAEINRSSGNAAYDAAAIQSAKDTTFTPKVSRCQPVAAEGVFRVEFPAIQDDCNRAAKVVTPMNPDYPNDMKTRGIAAAVVLVLVHLGADGKVTSVAVQKSSGYPSFDRVALRAASQSTYSAEIHECQAVEGAYVFRAEFMVQ